MPLTVADRVEILELLARYAHAIDTSDGEAYADCFTDDGVIELRSSGLHVQGRAALVEFAREDHARGGAARHLTNSPIIEGDGDRATIRVYLLRLTQDRSLDERRGIGPVGFYHDTLRRIAGRWRFERREAFIDPQG
jgi:ketosteroid isomerase-like protein